MGVITLQICPAWWRKTTGCSSLLSFVGEGFLEQPGYACVLLALPEASLSVPSICKCEKISFIVVTYWLFPYAYCEIRSSWCCRNHMVPVGSRRLVSLPQYWKRMMKTHDHTPRLPESTPNPRHVSISGLDWYLLVKIDRPGHGRYRMQ